ncbi:MAG TPA: tyrosine-protein phosphatase [Gemmataceae bacterium]|nr:tyrosine-protein phosphatase [Gemmataceae bacterium]
MAAFYRSPMQAARPLPSAKLTRMFPALLNARDLGGYPTVDGAITKHRSLLRADDLAQLSPAGLRALGDYGVATVLDLRWPEEIAAAPSPVPQQLPGVRYVSVSLLAQSAADWGALGGHCPKELWKCTVLERLRPQLNTALAVIAAAGPDPLLFHCVAGKDRTGVIAALLLTLAEVVPGAIAADYAASTENLRQAYLRRYRDADPAAIVEVVRCPEEAVYNMLAYLDRAGGIRAYLRGIGLSEAEISRLRARLRGN